MPGELDALPGGEVGIDVAARVIQGLSNLGNLWSEVDLASLGLAEQGLELVFQVDDGVFEVQGLGGHHSGVGIVRLRG